MVKGLPSVLLYGANLGLPFNRDDRKFIRKAKDNGLIELVLFWTEEGFGMVIQTTGRNIRETEEIARILDEKYGKA